MTKQAHRAGGRKTTVSDDPIVQAVAEAIWHTGWCTGDQFDPHMCDDDSCQDAREEQAEAVLAAARPLIEREAKVEAWDEGYRTARSDHRGYGSCATGDHGQQNVNPYREQEGQ